MSEQEKFDRMWQKHPQLGPQHRSAFYERPHWTRRRFFELTGAAVSGAFLSQRYAAAAPVTALGAMPKNTAKNVIFLLMAGAPSHTDTFDFKVVPGVTPVSFAPETVNGTLWPTGLLPKLGHQLSDFAIVRSLRSHALVHSLAQVWTQIGRNPVGGPSIIAPNIGSVVAIEKEPERQPGQTFPTFLALNSFNAEGPGYMPAKFGAFKVTAGAGGIANASHPAGSDAFQRRLTLLNSLDSDLRIAAPPAKPMQDYGEFYGAAQGLMYSPAVDRAFTFSSTDHARYGASSLGDACLVATQVLKAQQGTRFIQITSNDGWDMHYNIYQPNYLPAKGKLLDDALSALLADLKSGGLLDSTLVVMVGEFGRTVGPLTGAGGRDHHPQQFAFFAGGGVKGGTIVGATNASGDDVADFGWSRQRYVYTEDIEATIYSALGIDWTTVRQDDPLHRGFEYVPLSAQDVYAPVHELWG